MKSKKFMTLNIIVLIFTLLSFNSNVFAQDLPLKVSVDGHLINFTEDKPFMHNNRVWVPLRIVSENLSAKVTFDPYNRNNPVTKVERANPEDPINNRYAIFAIGTPLIFTNEDFPIDMQEEAMLINNRTYVPIRPLCEAFNLNVNWDHTQKLVEIYT